MPTVTPYKQNRLQQLRGFCYAARRLSISKAAEMMYLSQPSVSLQIKALEQELGVKLFNRRGPQLSLTYDGRQLLELANPLVEGIDRLDEAFAARRETPDRGQVTVAAGGSTLQYILPPFIEKFMQQHPHVDVRLHNVTGKGGLQQLRDGAVDMAVGPLLETTHDIDFHPMVTHEPMLIMRRDHPLATRKRISLKDICKYPLILPPKEQSTYRFVERVFTDHSLDYEVRLEVGGYDVIKSYVRLGMGISVVMSHCIGADDDDLSTMPMGRYFPKRAYGVILIKKRPLPAPAQELVKTLLGRDRA